jgi:PAS domain S-box-containing protein
MISHVGWMVAALAAGVVAGWLGAGWRGRRRRLRARDITLAQMSVDTRLCWGAELPGGRLAASPPFGALFGPDLVGDRMTVFGFLIERCHPEELRRMQGILDDVLLGRRVFAEGEMRLRCADGDYHRFTARVVGSWNSHGRPYLLTGSLHDLTRTREIEEERDRLFNLSVDMLGISDFEGNFLQVNPAWVRILRWSRDDIMSRPLTDLIHPEDRAAFASYLQRLQAGEPVRDLEMRAECRDGSFRWISWSSFPLSDRRQIFTVAHDVTEKREADVRLEAYQTRLRDLASELATVEDRERRQLAETLHDSLAQDLFAARAKVALLKYPDRLADSARVVNEAISILDQSLNMTRNLTFELCPPALYEVGLEAGLEWLCRHFETTRGLRCTIETPGDNETLPQDLRALTYRIVRELLANIHKHAEARLARVTVAYAANHLVVTVDDDGKALALDGDDNSAMSAEGETARKGFGLFSIRERLRCLAGNLAIEPSPLGGWRVVMTLPLPDRPD